MKRKNIEKALKEIESLLEESEENISGAAMGFDEGFYTGESNAYSVVLGILEEAIKG